MDEIAVWARATTARVHAAWQATPHALSDHGFGVFYSPPVARPALMVVGFNPAGDASHFDAARVMELPDRHEYSVWNYPLARAMIRLFERIERRPLLEASVKVNLIPFRSPNKKAWYRISTTAREALERISREVFLDVVRTLAPPRILTEGTQTFDKAVSWMGEAHELTRPAEVRGHRGRRIYVTARARGFMLIGIPHLSWPVAQSDMVTLAERLRADLA